MRYFTWKLELVSDILWVIVACSLYEYKYNKWRNRCLVMTCKVHINIVWTMSARREVSKESAFSTSLTVFKANLIIWTSLQNDQNLTSVFLGSRDVIEALPFLNAIMEQLIMKDNEQEMQLTAT